MAARPSAPVARTRTDPPGASSDVPLQATPECWPPFQWNTLIRFVGKSAQCSWVGFGNGSVQHGAARNTASSAPLESADPVGEVAPDEAASVESEEVLAYREAHAAWRAGDSEACIDRFAEFLQNYPSSEYADDATYWLADCYFKQGNFSAAVLRFDDVARQYPSGNKAADALYRQGEALLRMGHGKAAGNAFEKVLQDYPDSARAPEAKKQLDLLGSG